MARTDPRVWTIDVCRTCGRHAVWPYCEHRPEGYRPLEAESWCEPVLVREVRPVGRPRKKRVADGQSNSTELPTVDR